MADNTLHSSARNNWLERRFALRSRGGTLRSECWPGSPVSRRRLFTGGHPGLLAIGGMDKGAATTGTILVFVVGSLLMAFYANLPFIVGPGIGGSVLVGVTLAGSEGLAGRRASGSPAGRGSLLPADPLWPARSGHPLGAAVDQAGADGLHRPVRRRPRLSQRRAGARQCQNQRPDARRLPRPRRAGGAVRPVLAIALQARKVPGAILWAILCATGGDPVRRHETADAFYRCPHSLAPVLGEVDLLGR